MQFLSILTSIALLCTLMSPTISPAYAQGRDSAIADATIIDMAQAYRQRDRARLLRLLPQASGHPLEPWAAYWALSARLDEASHTEIQDYFARYSGTYQEDKLRNEWLLQLGKNREWEAFNRAYPQYRMNDDRSVRCYALLAEHLSTGANVSARVQETWFALREADQGCASTAAQLLENNSLSAHTVWLRARLGMEMDNLRITTQAVGLLNESWNKTVNAIYLNPAKYLNEKWTAIRPKTRELVSLALIRLAYLDPDAAATEIEHLRWKTQLTQEERNWVWAVIGKRAAQKLLPDALRYFENSNPQTMQADHLAWLARAALRAGRWEQVLTAIMAMPEAQRLEPTWIYWRARAMLYQANTGPQRAFALRFLEGIAGVRGFYEQLAQEELGRKISLPPRPAPLSADEKERARQNPGLSRALYAIAIGLRSEGVREWNYTTNLHTPGGMDDRSLLAAADLACSHEIWDRCINTSERTKLAIHMEQRFPMPFKSQVIERSTQIAIDPAYVYGLIRQESRFTLAAQSAVGAAGLMQVMPATARWTAKKIGLTDFQPQDITDRDTNIAIGTGYLKLVLDSFAGSMPLATAAYNAGPSRARAWRGSAGAPELEGAIWAETVPFSETRDYVKKVLANTSLYAAMITGKDQSLKARLGSVGPLEAAPTEADLNLP